MAPSTNLNPRTVHVEEAQSLLFDSSPAFPSSLDSAPAPPHQAAAPPAPVPPLQLRAKHSRRQSSLSRPAEDGRPRTPRTPNRVRFEIEERRSAEEQHEQGDGHALDTLRSGHAKEPDGPVERGPYAPRHWVEDEDYLDDGAPVGGQRERLLEGLQAPSVTVAEDWGTGRAKSGLGSAFMNMANSIIGAGIIGQPYAFKQAGLLTGVLLLVGLTITVDWTIRLIVLNSKLSGATSFQATVEHCFGKRGLIAISLAQWAFAFGGMVAFCVIVGDSIPHVLTAVFPSLPGKPVLWLLSDRNFIIIFLVLGISYPLSLYRDIAKLAKASTLALISMLVIITTVITRGATVDSDLRGPIAGSLLINGGIFQAIGVISFAFVCHHNSLLIYGSLSTPTLDRFALVTHCSTSVSMLACLGMALAGFLSFGAATLGNVLNNFPRADPLVNVARLCFGLNMLTTLPLEAFVCREVMLNYFWPEAEGGGEEEEEEEEGEEGHRREAFDRRRHVLLTSGLVAAAVAVSLTTCDLGAVFELIGATSACALAYILPPACYLKLARPGRTRSAMAWACVGFGVAVMAISTAQAVVRMVGGGGEGKKQCA